jgi:RNA polymerase sigma-70 factor (ECF subfamily)
MAASAETLAMTFAGTRPTVVHESRTPRRELVDARHLERIAAGDQQAMAEAFDRASSVVYGMALRMLLDPRDAEEAMMDTFLHVWRKAVTFNSALGNPSVWLIMIARCRILDRLRMQKTRRQYEESLGEDWDAPSHAPDAEKLSIQRLDAASVRTALAELNPSQKEALELAYFQGMTQEEIADATRRPLGTVKTQIRQGLLKLRQLMSEANGYGSAKTWCTM